VSQKVLVVSCRAPCRRSPRHRSQRGLSLLFALLALAAMMLAAVALVRSVDSGTIVLGNLGFKQDATAAADRAADAAVLWLKNTTKDLSVDHVADGYYASSQDSLDPTGQVTSATNKLAIVDWDRDGCAGVTAGTYASCTRTPVDPTPYNGVSTRYVITRLCPNNGSAGSGNACAQVIKSSTSTAKDQGGFDYGKSSTLLEKAYAPYYRVIVRSVGARNTVSYTETIVR